MTDRDIERVAESDVRAESEERAESAFPSSEDAVQPALVDDPGALLERWQQVQARFVDSPREAVNEASDVVEDVLARLSHSFDAERRRLDDAWESGTEPSTEELRVALRRYRAFFERLLAA